VVVSALWAVSNSTNFALSSLFCFSKVAIHGSSHHFSLGRRDDSDGIIVSLFALAPPPVQSFLQSRLSVTYLPSLSQQSLLR
jgi:hypothetical protein